MTLDDAISYAKDTSLKILCSKSVEESCKSKAERAERYLQIAKWLEELKQYKQNFSSPSKDILNPF